MQMAEPTHIDNYAVVLRHGAAEVYVKHNVHASEIFTLTSDTSIECCFIASKATVTKKFSFE